MTTTVWPDTLELTLEGIAQGGEGVGRWNDRVVFVGGGLPGERVYVRLTERHGSYARGIAEAVITPAPDRVAPRLPGADHMPWQHIAYPAQLRFKRQILADQLAKIAGLAGLPVREAIAAPRPWAYRNSARLHGAGQQVGYYAADSRALQPIEHDPLLLPALDNTLAALHEVLRAGAPAPGEMLLRASETHGYVLAALRGGEPGGLRRLAGLWRMRCPALAGITLLSHPHEVLGASELAEELDGIQFQLRPTGFFQVNLAGAATLLGLVRAGLGLAGGERVLDLYCGVGTFALPLARAAAEVVGVEEYAGAVEDARATAGANAIANAHFEVGRVEQVLARFEGPFDVVVLDPPRRGCHPRAIAELLRLAPARIVYVSCHPATLARDLKLLIDGGYRALAAQPVDLFPQTAHIESVVVLEHS
jgi:23S rRNA (uracil1939-C5)-methyltransferase